jgi:hypothetical protein
MDKKQTTILTVVLFRAAANLTCNIFATLYTDAFKLSFLLTEPCAVKTVTF